MRQDHNGLRGLLKIFPTDFWERDRDQDRKEHGRNDKQRIQKDRVERDIVETVWTEKCLKVLEPYPLASPQSRRGRIFLERN